MRNIDVMRKPRRYTSSFRLEVVRRLNKGVLDVRTFLETHRMSQDELDSWVDFVHRNCTRKGIEASYVCSQTRMLAARKKSV